MSYVGDARIGKNTNIGAGTVTCNYDGVTKHRTVIGEDVFIGSNTMLIAPVTVGNNSMTGSGSVITKDIPADDLAISRSKQKNNNNGKSSPNATAIAKNIRIGRYSDNISSTDGSFKVSIRKAHRDWLGRGLPSHDVRVNTSRFFLR